MLKKLFKYDMKWINKFMLPFMGITIVSAILNRVFYELMDINFIFTILYFSTVVVTNGLIINLIFNVIIRNIVRFKKQIYGDESYLVHTLPVKRSSIIISKILSSILSVLLCIILAIICLSIEYLTPNLLDTIKQLLNMVNSIYNISPIGLIIILSLYIILMVIWITEMLYASMILGNRSNNKKVLKSFIWGVILYIITQVCNLIFVGIFSLVNSDMLNLFKTNIMSNNLLKPLLIILIFINLIYSIGYFILNIKLINKKLNVD